MLAVTAASTRMHSSPSRKTSTAMSRTRAPKSPCARGLGRPPARKTCSTRMAATAATPRVSPNERIRDFTLCKTRQVSALTISDRNRRIWSLSPTIQVVNTLSGAIRAVVKVGRQQEQDTQADDAGHAVDTIQLRHVEGKDFDDRHAKHDHCEVADRRVPPPPAAQDHHRR